MTTINSQMIQAANQKIHRMPLGTFSRLKVDGNISDIVVRTSSSGVYFYNVPGTIDNTIHEKQIGFKYYSELN